MELLSSKILKQKFQVHARFYHMDVKGTPYLMRREARIIQKGASHDVIDAVFVMLNPGSCAPENPISYTTLENSRLELAKPDQTQYQLMNLMDRMYWGQIAIVNLSDICEGNSKKFEKIIRDFIQADAAHSIFQDSAEKLFSNLNQSETIIYAWGSSDLAKRLASEYGVFVNGRPTERYKNTFALIHETKQYPRHPKPALVEERLKWIVEMTELLNEKKKIGLYL